MGTRADFYVGRGEQAEWFGSIAFDGYPDGNPANKEFGGAVIEAASEQEFRERTAALIGGLDHATKPDMGWPWPWETSSTTDYAYAFDGGKVWASCFGREWFDPTKEQPENLGEKVVVFPDMKERQKVTMGLRSGC